MADGEYTVRVRIRDLTVRIVCVAYLGVLTWALLSSDTSHFEPPTESSILTTIARAAHLGSFAILTVLVIVARWPIPLWAVAVSLVAYCVGTEFLQWFIPNQAMEVQDMV